MTTEQSLNKLFSKPGWYKISGIHESTARVYKKRFKDGQLNLETQIMILESCGFIVSQEMKWEEQNSHAKLKRDLTAKLNKENAFWSYNLDSTSVVSDEKLIEMVLIHLDIHEIKSLFQIYSKRMIQSVWKEKMLSQEPLYHGLNRLYAYLFLGIKDQCKLPSDPHRIESEKS